MHVYTCACLSVNRIHINFRGNSCFIIVQEPDVNFRGCIVLRMAQKLR